MTLGQFFLGCVAILVATLVYRWQKTVDRETVALIELRKLMAAYAALSHKLFLKQPYLGVVYEPSELEEFFTISDNEIELYTLRDQLYVCAPEAVLETILSCDEKFRNWKIKFPKNSDASDEVIAEIEDATSEFKFAHERMLTAMRNELVIHNKMPWPSFNSPIVAAVKRRLN